MSLRVTWYLALHALACTTFSTSQASPDTSEVDVGLTLLNVHMWLPVAANNVTAMFQCVSPLAVPEGLTFKRYIDTGHSLEMPKGDSITQISPTSGVVQEILSENGPSRFGAYYCMSNSSSTKVVSFKLPPKSDAAINAENMFLKARIGEDVILEVTQKRQENPDRGKLRWRHNSNLITKWDDQFLVIISNVTTEDSGIYECYNEGTRALGLHALFKVFVFRCSTGKYGPNCESFCKPCYNGGVCEEDSGKCICPPGFGGTNCQIPCGPNSFGLNCSNVCYPHEPHLNASSLDVRHSCAYYWFCLPDPYGCTCGSGFHGDVCLENCKPGTYGTDCSQTCHCADHKSCDDITGQCDQGVGCAPGWLGISCQIRESPSLKSSPVFVTSNATTISLSWSSWTYGNDSGGWPDTRAEYMLLVWNTTKYIPLWKSWRNITDSLVTGLEPNKKYMFSVETRDALRWWQPKGEGEESIAKSSSPLFASTTCGLLTVKSVPRNFTATIIESDAIHFAWEHPTEQDLPCSLQGYVLSVFITGAREDKAVKSNLKHFKTNHKLTGLKSNTNYTVSLSVITPVGIAPFGAAIRVATPPGELPAVYDLLAFDLNGDLRLAWSPPKLKGPGAVGMTYEVNAYLLHLNACLEFAPKSTPQSYTTTELDINLTDLSPYATYEVSVSPVMTRGPKGRPVATVQTTSEAAPSAAPENLKEETVNDTVLQFSWDPLPCQHANTNPSNIKYEWNLKTKLRESDEYRMESHGKVDSGLDALEVQIGGVQFHIAYIFTVRAFSIYGNGPEGNLSRTIQRDDSLSLTFSHQTSNSITVNVVDTEDTVAPSYRISMCQSLSQNPNSCLLTTVNSAADQEISDSVSYDQQNLTQSALYYFQVQRMILLDNWGAWSKAYNAYTTAAEDDYDDNNVLQGTEETPEPPAQNEYRGDRDMFFVAESAEKTDDKSSISCGILILIVIAVLLILIMIVAIAIYYYRRKKNKTRKFVMKADKSCKRTSAEIAPLNSPIVKNSAQGQTKESSFQEVSLQPADRSSSILLCDGFVQNGEFMLMKMPAESKQEWFWSQVYNNRSSVIVMLNDCEFIDDTTAVSGQYWPHGDSFSRQFGRFTVDVVQTEEKGRVNMRIMRVRDSCQTDNESLGVVQLQYLDDWDSEKGVPKSCTSFLGLVLLALAQKQKRGGTIAVHCQDGEVRSGLFCVCCFLKQESDFGGRGDVMRAVRHFQTQKRPVLENEDQLRFGLQVAGLLCSDDREVVPQNSLGSSETFV